MENTLVPQKQLTNPLNHSYVNPRVNFPLAVQIQRLEVNLAPTSLVLDENSLNDEDKHQNKPKTKLPLASDFRGGYRELIFANLRELQHA